MSTRRIIRTIEKAGGRVRITGGGHLRVSCPRGLVFLPASPSDRRSLKNAEKELARRGIAVRLR